MRPATRRLVTFGIGEAWYAIDVAHVERVLRNEGVFPVPNMPPWMAGILEYQGRVIPVLDLRRRLGATGEGDAASGRLLLLTSHDDVVAAAVDRVVDVRPVADAEVAPPPALVRDAAGAFLCGVVRRNDAMVFVLDAERLLGSDDSHVFDPREAEAAIAAAAAYVGVSTDDGEHR